MAKKVSYNMKAGKTETSMLSGNTDTKAKTEANMPSVAKPNANISRKSDKSNAVNAIQMNRDDGRISADGNRNQKRKQAIGARIAAAIK